MTGEFSPTWFATFLTPETAAPVDREVAFIHRFLPVERFRQLLDVPCGIGRHAAPLAQSGYEVLGIDRNPNAVRTARQLCTPGASFQVMDMGELDRLPAGGFDGVLCLWQSFGYGDEAENLELLAAMRRRLRPGGRFVLDVYNADALRGLEAESSETRGTREISTRRRWKGPRFEVQIRYSDSSDVDLHDWLVYTPEMLTAAMLAVGFRVVTSCAWFDPDLPPSREHQRMQFLCENPDSAKASKSSLTFLT